MAGKMRNRGKYLKQSSPQGGIHIVPAVFAAILFGISSVAFYKAGERSAARLQETEPYTCITIQETEATKPTAKEITEPTEEEITKATEVTTQPIVITQPTTEATKPAERTGTVLRSAGELRVRSGAGTNYTEISRLNGGDAVTIYEQKSVNGTAWGNIGYGWVCMDYIVFGVDTSVAPVYTPSVDTYTPPPVYQDYDSDYNSTQNPANQGSTNTTKIPKRFGSSEIKEVLIREAKAQLGYRYGDEFSMSTPFTIGYNSDTGKYNVYAHGRWCGSNYYISAFLQDVNGVLVVYKVLECKVK